MKPLYASHQENPFKGLMLNRNGSKGGVMDMEQGDAFT